MFEQAISMMALGGFITLMYWLDKKYELGLNEMACGKSSSTQLKKENQALKERIETLEAIVTEPAYELNRQLAKLK